MPPYLALTTLALRLASFKQSPGLFINVTHYIVPEFDIRKDKKKKSNMLK